MSITTQIYPKPTPEEEKLGYTISPFEIESELDKMDNWKKAQNLPLEYGTIREDDKYWIILKRYNLEPFMTLPFRDVLFIVGLDTDQQKFYLHSIHYPKERYPIGFVKSTAYLTTNCPYCIEGTKFVLLRNLENAYKIETAKSYQSSSHPQEHKKIMTKSDFWGRRVGMNGLSFDTVLLQSGINIATNVVLDNTVGKLVNGSADNVIVRALSAGVGLITPLIMSFTPLRRHERIMRHLTLFGLNMLQTVVDPSPVQIADIKIGFKRIYNAMHTQGIMNGFKEAIRKSPKGYGGPINGPPQLVACNQGYQPKNVKQIVASPKFTGTGSTQVIPNRRTTAPGQRR